MTATTPASGGAMTRALTRRLAQVRGRATRSAGKRACLAYPNRSALGHPSFPIRPYGSGIWSEQIGTRFQSGGFECPLAWEAVW